jgi:hypothetical protein
VSTPVRSTEDSPGGVEEVFAVLTAASWVERRAAELRDGGRVVRREERPDGGVLLAVSRELPAAVPGFLDRFLPADGRVTQTDEWGGPRADGTRTGTWSVQLPGAPASLGGTLLLEPLPAGPGQPSPARQPGSRYTVAGEVTVRVPLVGGRAEKLIAEMVVKLSRKEMDLLRRPTAG